MKKLISLFIILFFVSGCWNYKELDDYSIVTGIAIDINEEEYEVSVLISNTKKSSDSSSDSSSQSVVYSGMGDSIFSAFKDIGKISPKELYLDHFTLLVISEDVATKGLYNIVDFFLRYPMVRKDFSIALAKDCKAKDTLKIVSPLTDYPSQSVADNLQSTSKLQGSIINLNYNELVYELIADGQEITMSTIKIIGDEKEGSKQDNIKSSEPKTYLKLDNIAVFKGDKLVDFANKTESIGINIINGNATEMHIKVDTEEGYVVCNTVEFSSEINIKFKNNKPIISINVNGNAKIMELNGSIDLHDNKTVKEIQKKLNNKIKKYMEESLNFAIKNKTDIFGFGKLVYKKNPNYFNKVKKTWNEDLGDLKINIKSDLTIKSVSSTENSVEVLNAKQ